MITSASLCTGYDGLGRGLSLLQPHTPLWHAEVDADMSHVLKIHDPDTRNVGDMTKVPWNFAPRPDVLTAGVPCQPISIAGRGDGDADERYLWPYAVECFREVRPPFIFIENVERLTSMKTKSGANMLQEWLTDLWLLGYAVTWTVIGACAVGAPHHRHRVYIWAAYVGSSTSPPARRIVTPCGAPRTGGRVLLPTPTTSDTNGPGRATKTGGDDLRTAVDLLAAGDTVWGKYAEAVATWEAIIGRPAPDPTEPNSKGGRRLSPLLTEWMMGLPLGTLTDHLPRNAAIKAAGNGVVPLQAAAAQRLLAAVL